MLTPMSFQDLERTISLVLENNERVIFLDVNAIRPPIYPFETLPFHPHPSNRPKSPIAPNDIFGYLDARIRNHEFDALVNETLRESAEHYFKVLFGQIEKKENLLVAESTFNELKFNINSFRESYFSLPFINLEFWGNLHTKKAIYENLENHLDKLPAEKIIDLGHDETAKRYKKTLNLKAGVEDLTLFITACTQALIERKDFEIWSRDKHFVSMARQYEIIKEKHPKLPKVFIRYPYTKFSHISQRERTESMNLTIRYPANEPINVSIDKAVMINSELNND